MLPSLLGVESSLNSYRWVQKPFEDKEAEDIVYRRE